MAVTDTYDDIFQDVGKKYGIDPLWLKARAIYESGLDPKFKNKDSSASGIGAFTDATAKDYNVDRTDPRSSIDAMARYDVANYNKFKDHPDPVKATISAYKTGPNSDALDDKYIKNVTDVYQDLKSNQPKMAEADTRDPVDIAVDKWRSYAAPETDSKESKPSLDDQAVTKWRSYSQPEETAAATVAPTEKPPDFNNLAGPELEAARKANPEQYQKFMEKNANMAEGAFEYGAGDVPRSIANVAASVSPSAFSAIGRAAAPAYAALTGQPPLTQGDLDSAPPSADAAAFKGNLQDRNAQFNQEFGGNPNADLARLAGEAVASAPAMAGINKAAGMVGDAVASKFPSLEPTINALSGSVESNAQVNALGDTVKSATIGNQLAQYGAAGLNAGLQAVPVTGLTNAGSDVTLGKQLGQNAIVGAGIGALAPAAYDAGVGSVNMLKQLGSSSDDLVTQKAHGALQSLLGEPINSADLTEYVPGSKPTLAKAAAYAGDPNAGSAAALEKTLGESNVGNANLYNEGFKKLEQENDLARRNHVLDLTGTPDDVTDLQKARSAEANKLMGNEAKRLADPNLPKGEVWQNNGQTDVKKALDYIEAVRQGPAAGNASLTKRLDRVEELLKDPQAKDPQYLYESVIKPQLTDPIEAINPFDSNNATKSQLPYLKQMKSILDDTVGAAAPKYKDYLKTYTTMSRNVERQQGLQSLNLVNPEDPNSAPTLAKVNAALKKIQAGRQNYDPTDSFKAITDTDVNKLVALQKDLQREGAANNLLTLKGAGSPTSQKVNFTKKVQNTLGGEPSKIPGTILGAAGAMGGEGIAMALGHPWVLGAPLASGLAGVGHAAGNKLAEGLASKSSDVADRVSNLLLSPQEYFQSQQGSPVNLLRSSGQLPFVQGTLGYAAPYGAVEANRLLSRSAPSSGDSQ
jgi:hypothetical protein